MTAMVGERLYKQLGAYWAEVILQGSDNKVEFISESIHALLILQHSSNAPQASNAAVHAFRARESRYLMNISIYSACIRAKNISSITVYQKKNKNKAKNDSVDIIVCM